MIGGCSIFFSLDLTKPKKKKELQYAAPRDECKHLGSRVGIKKKKWRNAHPSLRSPALSEFTGKEYFVTGSYSSQTVRKVQNREEDSGGA